VDTAQLFWSLPARAQKDTTQVEPLPAGKADTHHYTKGDVEMAETLQFFVTAGQVVAAAFFAMVPGAAVWLTVIGIYLLFRKAAQGGRQQASAQGPAA
jgi:hypothetical protein